jgi:SPP1 family predicted phage head-tail adaptor
MTYLNSYDAEICLLKETTVTDKFGETIRSFEETKVYADIASVGTREVYEGLAAGVRPEIKFIMGEPAEYLGQTRVKYNDVIYRVVRSYINFADNNLELTCSRIVNQSNPYEEGLLYGGGN